MAKINGKRVTDYLALAMANDPFYIGQEAELKKAKWFTDIYDSGILARQSHLRGIHYVLVSQNDSITLPDGRPYENTQACWAFLGTAAKSARYLELVDPRAFKDRRSQPPKIFTPTSQTPTIDISGSYYLDLELPYFPDLPSYRIDNFTGTQKYMTEIWIEKSTMEDELLPLCEQYGCNLVTGVGELSITQCIQLIDRIIQYQRPCRVLYISDFDPAGRSMPVAVSRKIEFYQRNKYPDLDIQIQQIALTFEQCQKYKLPRTPIKETERRLEKFQAIYGDGATELDALEALYPGEIAKIIRGELERFNDDSLSSRCSSAANSLRKDLERRRDIVVAQYMDQINDLKDRYDILTNRFESEIGEISEHVGSIWHAIRANLVESQPYDIEIPEAYVEPEKEWSEPLYKSDRSYEDQLRSYCKFKNGE